MKIVLRVFIVLSLGLIASCGEDEPNALIRGMNPNQVSIGQINAIGSITGDNLTATAVSLGEGISVTGFTVKSSSEIEVAFNVENGAVPGPRTITLTTTSGSVSANSLLNVMSNKVPKAQFKISPSAGSLATNFEFDASGSVDQQAVNAAALSYAWDFGDGSSASGKLVKHKYKELGVHEVSLKVTDEQSGFAVASRSVEVLKNSPPVPVLKVNPGVKGDTNTRFVLDGSRSKDPDGRVTDYIWDPGDGSRKKRGSLVEHTYAKPGAYTVSLTVVDNKGQLASDELELKIEKATKIRCKPKTGKGADYFFDVVSSDRAKHIIIAKFEEENVCAAYYECGDIRIGGFPPKSPGTEKWVGIMCDFYDLGGGLAEIHTKFGYYWPQQGDENFYTHAQLDCRPSACGR